MKHSASVPSCPQAELEKREAERQAKEEAERKAAAEREQQRKARAAAAAAAASSKAGGGSRKAAGRLGDYRSELDDLEGAEEDEWEELEAEEVSNSMKGMECGPDSRMAAGLGCVLSAG